jgi:hypothetical protein
MTMWLSQFSSRFDVVDLVTQFETSTRDRLMGQLAMWTMYITATMTMIEPCLYKCATAVMTMVGPCSRRE